SDRPAQRSFRRDMTHHQTVSCAAEASVGKQRDRAAQAFADEGAGYAEHLAHPGSTFGAFVADDDDVSGLDFLRGHRRHGIFFAVEYTRRTAMAQSLVAADLGYATFGR